SAQVMDVNWNGIGFEFLLEPIEFILKDGFRDDTAKAPHQMLQDGAFPAREWDVRRIHAHIPSNRVKLDVACLEIEPQRTAWPPQQCFGACNEFGDCEGLDQIIICPSVEARYALLHGVASGQHEDRNRIAPCPQLGQQVETVPIR